MNAIIERVLKLFAVKSIMTLVLTVVFCYLAVTGKIEGDKFYGIYLTVVTFYFGVQAAKGLKE